MNDLEIFFVNSILKWFANNKRNFPWRMEQTSPYQILVAELLLKKTRAENVVEIYNEFIKKFPKPSDIVYAKEQELQDLLEPLGLINQRIKAFKQIFNLIEECYGGIIPDSFNKLINLPYIGSYTANAVLCFGYGKKVPIVDVNITRVCQRYFGLDVYGDPRVDKHIWELLKQILPKRSSKEFNYAILDFASLICKSKKPNCNECVLRKKCLYIKL